MKNPWTNLVHFFMLMTASKGDESTKYSQSPCDDDERAARLKAALLYLRTRRYKKSVNEFRSRIWSWWPDLNWWPHPYQGCALPPEPHQHIFGGSGGIRTPVGFHPNGFQDRLVMTASIRFHIKSKQIVSFVFWNRFLSKRFDASLSSKTRLLWPLRYASI